MSAGAAASYIIIMHAIDIHTPAEFDADADADYGGRRHKQLMTYNAYKPVPCRRTL